MVLSNSSVTAGFYQPAEWEPHRAVWLAWPSHADLWQELLASTQSEFTELCRAIVDVDNSGVARGESLEVLVPDKVARAEAEVALRGLPVRFQQIPFGDIWLRDTAPLFLKSAEGRRATVRFAFNGWGGKYVLPYDNEVASEIAKRIDAPSFDESWVLEGGSVEVDGEATCLTTEQCLLNPNRNPQLTRAQVELNLRRTLGVEKILWLKEGLLNDHTDGHIDTIARFTSPGVVVCMQPQTKDDPNFAVLNNIALELEKMVDACGRVLQVVRVPSPGAIVDADGHVLAASYVNFYVGNTTVVVPTYGSPFDEAAVSAISKCFPGRRTVGRSARAILSGGGAFHCISQQEPL